MSDQPADINDPLGFLDEEPSIPSAPSPGPATPAAPPDARQVAEATKAAAKSAVKTSKPKSVASPDGAPASSESDSEMLEGLDFAVDETATSASSPPAPSGGTEMSGGSEPEISFRLDDLDVGERPASGASVSLAAGPPASVRPDRFAYDGGAPDERLDAPGDSGLLDDLEQLLPFEDPGSTDRIETEPLPVPDIFNPILEATVDERDLEAMPAGVGDLEQPKIARGNVPLEYVGTRVIVREHQDRPRDVSLDARPPRFAAWNKLWNGYLGWEGLGAPSERLIAGKLLARFALLGVVPVLLITALSLPFAGSSFGHTDADYSRSSLTYGRPILEFVPTDSNVQLGDSSYVSVRLLTQLRTLYANYFPDLSAAFVSGDAGPLRDILASDLYNTYAAQIASAHERGWTISFWDVGQLPESLSFTSVFPASGPQQVSAWSDSLTIIVADQGGTTISSTGYSIVNVSFGLTNLGWRITGLDMSAAPSPSPSSSPSVGAPPSATTSASPSASPIKSARP